MGLEGRPPVQAGGCRQQGEPDSPTFSLVDTLENVIY